MSEQDTYCFLDATALRQACRDKDKQLSDTKAELEEATRAAASYEASIKDFAQFQRHVACGTSRLGPVEPATKACLLDVAYNLDNIISNPTSKYLDALSQAGKQEAIEKAVAPYIEALEHIAGKPMSPTFYDEITSIAEEALAIRGE